jgi:spore maturation protein CgeB
MKVLQFCEEDKATAWQRSKAFAAIPEIELSILWHTPLEKRFPLLIRIFHSICHKLRMPVDKFDANRQLLTCVRNNQYDIIFIEKCLVLNSSTLYKIRKIQSSCKLILYMLDDFNGKGNSSIYFIKCLPFYDLVVTNKKHNITEYLHVGARSVFYFRNGFSEFVHRPVILEDSDMSLYHSEVCFIGTYEKERAAVIRFLADNGVKVTVWGWSEKSEHSGIKHENIINKNRHVYFDEFAKVVAGAKINLNFLRKANRDTETTRSIELPACRSFVISERTKEHLELFSEGVDMEFFESPTELLAKIKFYLNRKDLRDKIALSGWNKVQDLEYKEQLSKILGITS